MNMLSAVMHHMDFISKFLFQKINIAFFQFNQDHEGARMASKKNLLGKGAAAGAELDHRMDVIPVETG